MWKSILAIGVAWGLFACRASAADDVHYIKLVHVATGKVLSITDASDDAGAKAMLAKDDGSPATQWKIDEDGGLYKATNRKSGKVLDVEMDSREEGGAIIQWDEKTEGNDNQRWAWEGDGETRRVKSKSSGLVLDVGEGDAIVQKKPDDASKTQLWRAVPVEEKFVKIVNADTGKLLSIEGDSEDNEAKAVLVKEQGNQSQQWRVQKDGDWYKLVNRKSGRVLDVNNQSKEEGGSIIQWDDKADDNDNQRWALEGGDDQKGRRIKSKSSELVLDVDDMGYVVQKKADDKAKGQVWRVVEVKEQ
jgi:hypothetical protein